MLKEDVYLSACFTNNVTYHHQYENVFCLWYVLHRKHFHIGKKFKLLPTFMFIVSGYHGYYSCRGGSEEKKYAK